MELKFLEDLGRDLRDTILRLLRDYSEALLLAILMAVILRTFVLSAYKISNLTMEPNLKLGDFIIGYKLPYGVNIPFTDLHVGQGRPRRGEVLLFKCPRKTDLICMKRVVGLEGDRIEIRGKRLFVNGRRARYVKSSQKPSEILSQQGDFVVLTESLGESSRDILVSNIKSNSDFGPLVVPPRTFFALGDNRDFSEDSRHWGPVPLSSIEARALFVWLSVAWMPQDDGGYRSHLRWDRIFSWVH